MIEHVLCSQHVLGRGEEVHCMWRFTYLTGWVLFPRIRGRVKNIVMCNFLLKLFVNSSCLFVLHFITRSSAIAEGPRDASCQLKSCQLPRNSAVRQVLNKSKLWSWRVKLGRGVVNICTQPWCVRVAFIVIVIHFTCHKQTDDGRIVYITYTDDLLWRNFLSPQCRNCSRDSDHAHLGSTHSSQG